jgi:hypothetical protein
VHVRHFAKPRELAFGQMTGGLLDGSYRLVPAHLPRHIGQEFAVAQAIHGCTAARVAPADEPLRLCQPTSSKHSICTCHNTPIEVSALPCQTHADVWAQGLLALMTIAVQREGLPGQIRHF